MAVNFSAITMSFIHSRPLASNRIKSAKAILASSAILGSLSFFSGVAQAAPITTTFHCNFLGGLSVLTPPSPTPDCNTILNGVVSTNVEAIQPNQFLLGDKLFTFLGAGNSVGAATPGHIAFSWFDPDGAGNTYENDTWSTLTDFDAPVTGSNSGFVDYTLQVTDLNWRFSGVKLDSTVSSAEGVTVKKYINDPTFTTPYLTSTVGSADPTTGFKPLGGSLVTVRDTWDVSSIGVLNSLTNTYTQTTGTPGPLPLFGAGAAFGFSRRIRRRIKGARLA
jgi:hypothetical protein